MCIHKITPESEDLKTRGFHHDKVRALSRLLPACVASSGSVYPSQVNKEYSTATLLVYLNNVEEGGHTAFPCSALTQGGVEMRPVCTEAFARGARWYNGKRAVWFTDPDKGPGSGPVPASLQPVLDDLLTGVAEVCEEKAAGGHIVKPVKGTALLFYHDLVNGTGDPLAYHAGCEVKRGVKWTMQKVPAYHARCLCR